MPMADRDEKRNNRGMDTLFSGILMLLAAVLLLLANLYTTELWPVKAGPAADRDRCRLLLALCQLASRPAVSAYRDTQPPNGLANAS